MASAIWDHSVELENYGVPQSNSTILQANSVDLPDIIILWEWYYLIALFIYCRVFLVIHTIYII